MFGNPHIGISTLIVHGIASLCKKPTEVRAPVTYPDSSTSQIAFENHLRHAGLRAPESCRVRGFQFFRIKLELLIWR